MIDYRLKLEKDDNDTILVTSPDFPLVTYGDTRDDAMKNAIDAAHVLLQSMITIGRPFRALPSARTVNRAFECRCKRS